MTNQTLQNIKQELELGKQVSLANEELLDIVENVLELRSREKVKAHERSSLYPPEKGLDENVMHQLYVGLNSFRDQFSTEELVTIGHYLDNSDIEHTNYASQFVNLIFRTKYFAIDLGTTIRLALQSYFKAKEIATDANERVL